MTSDFKREPVLRRLRTIWVENKGNWLLATVLIVSLLGWSVGYFDLIPDIRAKSRSSANYSSQNLLATGRTLIVKVTGCASNEGRVVGMIFNAESFDADAVPLRVQTHDIVQLHATWTIHNLQFGSYIAFAFHDVNGDDRLTPDTERQGLSRLPQSASAVSEEEKTTGRSAAVFEFDEDKEEVIIELRE